MTSQNQIVADALSATRGTVANAALQYRDGLAYKGRVAQHCQTIAAAIDAAMSQERADVALAEIALEEAWKGAGDKRTQTAMGEELKAVHALHAAFTGAMRAALHSTERLNR